MQFVWTHKVFGYLQYLPILISRQELRTHWCVHDVEQNLPDASASRNRCCKYVLCRTLDQISHECFRHAGIHCIHRHMVSIVGCPTQCKFRQVSGADYDSAGLVCNIHKYLSPFPCLGIFISDIVDILVVSYVLEMLVAGCHDGYFP